MQKEWNLSRYARFQQSSKGNDNNWEYFDTSSKPLTFLIKENQHLLLYHGANLMESFCLSSVLHQARGVSKGDSLMLTYKINQLAKRFRVKFASGGDDISGEKACRECSEMLSKHIAFQFLTSTNETMEMEKDTQPTNESSNINLSNVAMTLTGDSAKELRTLYKDACNIPPESLATVLRLCLTDPAFPAFVQQVENALQEIQKK